MDPPSSSPCPSLSRTVKLGIISRRVELLTAAERRIHRADESLVDSDYEEDVRDTLLDVFARENGPRKEGLRPLNPVDAELRWLVNYQSYRIPYQLSYSEIWHQSHHTKNLQMIFTHLSGCQFNGTAPTMVLDILDVSQKVVRLLYRSVTRLSAATSGGFL